MEFFFKYRAVWLFVAVFAWAWWHLVISPNQKQATPEVVQQVQEEPNWTCRVWDEPVDINGHSGTLERCWEDDKERYRLYVGNEVLVEEHYFKGVFLARGINTDLLKRLQKPPDLRTRSSYGQMQRSDI